MVTLGPDMVEPIDGLVVFDGYIPFCDFLVGGCTFCRHPSRTVNF
jgi:hypothetical protein